MFPEVITVTVANSLVTGDTVRNRTTAVWLVFVAIVLICIIVGMRVREYRSAQSDAVQYVRSTRRHIECDGRWSNITVTVFTPYGGTRVTVKGSVASREDLESLKDLLTQGITRLPIILFVDSTDGYGVRGEVFVRPSTDGRQVVEPGRWMMVVTNEVVSHEGEGARGRDQGRE